MSTQLLQHRLDPCSCSTAYGRARRDHCDRARLRCADYRHPQSQLLAEPADLTAWLTPCLICRSLTLRINDWLNAECTVRHTVPILENVCEWSDQIFLTASRHWRDRDLIILLLTLFVYRAVLGQAESLSSLLMHADQLIPLRGQRYVPAPYLGSVVKNPLPYTAATCSVSSFLAL